MKLLFDFFPVILFLFAYKLADIYVATAVMIGASVLQVAYHWFVHRKIEKMHIVVLVTVLVLGSATIFFRNELFIKWKPTAINWLAGLIFLMSEFFMKKPIIRSLLEEKVELPDFVWSRLNYSWVAFFFTMGLANLFVVYHYDTNTWVNFKVFGVLGLTFFFALLQGLYLTRHIEVEE